MSGISTPERGVARFFEMPWLAPPDAAGFTCSYERMMKGFANVAIQQIELTRDFMSDSIEDFSLLTQARTPDAFLKAEVEVIRRHSEKAVNAAKKLGAEWSRVWSDVTAISPQETAKAN